MEGLIELAGGPDAMIVFVPAAGGMRDESGKAIAYDAEKVLASSLRRTIFSLNSAVNMRCCRMILLDLLIDDLHTSRRGAMAYIHPLGKLQIEGPRLHA